MCAYSLRSLSSSLSTSPSFSSWRAFFILATAFFAAFLRNPILFASITSCGCSNNSASSFDESPKHPTRSRPAHRAA